MNPHRRRGGLVRDLGGGEMDVFLKREKEEGAQGGVPAEKEME